MNQTYLKPGALMACGFVALATAAAGQNPASTPPKAVAANPAAVQPGVANALNPQPLPPVDTPGVANALNPQPLPPIDKPGVVNALNPQPLPPEPPEKKRLKRRVLQTPSNQ